MDDTASSPPKAFANDRRRSAVLIASWRRLERSVATGRPWPLALVLLPLLTLLLLITAWLWRNSAAETVRVAAERFDFKLTESQFAIQQRLLAYEQILRGGVALFAASEEVTRDEWHAYVRALEIDKNFPGIQGIGFAATVRSDQLATHLRKVRAEGFPEYDIQPAGDRSAYSPIVFMEPLDWRNQRALGYDMLTDPTLNTALTRARDSGQAAASRKVKLIQETGDGVQNGFVMCLPVYKPGDAPVTIEQRRSSLMGHVCSPFRMRDLMQSILGPDSLPNIRLQIFDGSEVSGSPMFDTLEGASHEHQASFNGDRAFEFGGHQWILRFDSLPSFEASIDAQRPRLVLISGVLVSVLLTAVIGSLLLNRRRARELVVANGGLQAEIDERAKLEAELKRARDAAEAANQAKSEFLANVSHELRTPLTLILAPLEQLLAAPTPAISWREQIDRVQRNALLLMNRVNDILDFSKAEAGKVELRRQEVNLAQLIGVLAGDAAVAAQSKCCALTWEVDPALGHVFLDPQLFEKIALNLLSNAIKFTPTHGTIHVRVQIIDDSFFEFAVEDSGIGIAPDKLSLLFERFSQIDNSATRNYSGTGIGLALVKELTALMGGTVGVESEAGRGSRFFVRLPRGSAHLQSLEPAADASAIVDAKPTQQSDAARSASRLLRLHDGVRPPPATKAPLHDNQPQPAKEGALPRVLVVDDSPEILSYVCELLGEECSIVTAEDGEQAWDLLQRSPVDVIVSDVMMPRLDGMGLTARVKASAGLCHVPVILLTARGGADAVTSGLDSGADDYIAKPFSPSELKARVHASLRMSQMQSELRESSREAGMAQIATNVLHNVGNVLNSVNVSADLVNSKLRASKLCGLEKAARLMHDHADDLGRFLTCDDKGKRLPGYLNRLAETLAQEQRDITDELGQLTKSIGHIKEIVATQQAYASPSRMTETVSIRDIVDDALRMTAAALARHRVEISTELEEVPLLPLDRHRVLLILINLFSNAKYAMNGRPHQVNRITIRASLGEEGVLCVRVTDNGEGILPENLTRIFAYGFTTRETGHGFGLHSCASAALEMGGTLTAHSDGPGKGATFALEIPVRERATAA
jgi:signal transduction histidine kinase